MTQREPAGEGAGGDVYGVDVRGTIFQADARPSGHLGQYGGLLT